MTRLREWREWHGKGMVMVLESGYEDKISMMSNSIQFFTDYLTDNCLIEWFSAF